ncbi:MAG: DUF2817 domain-containing protein [Actinomycetota bacterium]
MMMRLPASYLEAREAFLAAADDVGATVDADLHPLPGREGEQLFVDVASIGPEGADDVLIVVSGTHGVEGYLGSALQRAHLASSDIERPGNVLVVFVHALNPHGFSWVRRVNEDNVDLNRNFIDWSSAPPTNPEYSELADILVPDDWSASTQERTLNALVERAAEVGFERIQEIVTKGQYEHPTGVFHGGTEATWSNRWLHGFLPGLGRRARVAVIDVHTGLGPWGHGELISCDAPDSAEFRRQAEWWGEVTSLPGGDSVSADIGGNWQAVLPGLIDAPEITGIGLEYGTVDGITVLQSLRADAVLWASGDPTGPGADDVRAAVRAAFCDDDPEWLALCWERYRAVVEAALGQLTR